VGDRLLAVSRFVARAAVGVAVLASLNAVLMLLVVVGLVGVRVGFWVLAWVVIGFVSWHVGAYLRRRGGWEVSR